MRPSREWLVLEGAIWHGPKIRGAETEGLPGLFARLHSHADSEGLGIRQWLSHPQLFQRFATQFEQGILEGLLFLGGEA